MQRRSGRISICPAVLGSLSSLVDFCSASSIFVGTLVLTQLGLQLNWDFILNSCSQLPKTTTSAVFDEPGSCRFHMFYEYTRIITKPKTNIYPPNKCGGSQFWKVDDLFCSIFQMSKKSHAFDFETLPLLAWLLPLLFLPRASVWKIPRARGQLREDGCE